MQSPGDGLSFDESKDLEYGRIAALRSVGHEAFDDEVVHTQSFLIGDERQPGSMLLALSNDMEVDIIHGAVVDITEPSYEPASRLRSSGDQEALSQAVDLLLQRNRPHKAACAWVILNGSAPGWPMRNQASIVEVDRH